VVSRLPWGEKLVAQRVGAFIDELTVEHLKNPDRFPGYGDRMREQLCHPGVGASFASTVLHYPWGSGPEFRRVGEHSRPVLLIWGDNDPATPYRNAKRVVELYPRAELRTICGARHAPHVDHAEEVHAAILEFLQRDPARQSLGRAE
jgi:pimeloyl-ACP methyl ester carboxylesterase